MPANAGAGMTREKLKEYMDIEHAPNEEFSPHIVN